MRLIKLTLCQEAENRVSYIWNLLNKTLLNKQKTETFFFRKNKLTLLIFGSGEYLLFRTLRFDLFHNKYMS